MSRPRGPVRHFVTGAGCALLIVAVLFAFATLGAAAVKFAGWAWA